MILIITPLRNSHHSLRTQLLITPATNGPLGVGGVAYEYVFYTQLKLSAGDWLEPWANGWHGPWLGSTFRPQPLCTPLALLTKAEQVVTSNLG